MISETITDATKAIKETMIRGFFLFHI